MKDGKSRRFALRFVLLVLVPLGVIAGGGYLYLIGGRFIATENAYVKNDIVHISADIDGRVTEVLVEDHRLVKQGDPLFRIDPEPFRIALARAEAEMASVRNEIASMRAEHRETGVELQEARERERFLRRQAERMRNLEQRGVATTVKLDEADHDVAMARERIEAIRRKMDRIVASLGGDLDTPIEKNPLFLERMARRDDAALQLARTTVHAPVDGIATNVKLQRGEYVEVGDSVFTLITAKQPWVEVNLKETELTHVRVGQRATVVVDAYPDVEWHAVVDSISPATGSEFAVLPPQNATGNWVKVVQRLPVRLRLEDRPGDYPLRAGMTVTATIDTERERALLQVIRSSWASIKGDIAGEKPKGTASPRSAPPVDATPVDATPLDAPAATAPAAP